MGEWPDGLLAGLDEQRSLPAALRGRLEDALLEPGQGDGQTPVVTRPLDHVLSARLADELVDPVASALAGVDAPRPLPPAVKRSTADALGLGGERRRRPPTAVLGAVAAGLALLAGVGIGLAVADRPHSTGSTAQRSSDMTGTSVAGTGDGRSAAGGAGGDFAATTQPNALAPTAMGAPSASAAAPAAAPVSPAVFSLSPDRGPAAGGTWIVITGTGFAGATGVRFGDSPAVAYSLLATGKLRALSPPHAPGVVDVVVIGPVGPSPNSPGDRFSFAG